MAEKTWALTNCRAFVPNKGFVDGSRVTGDEGCVNREGEIPGLS